MVNKVFKGFAQLLLLSSTLIGCTVLYAGPPKLAFGGYYFQSPEVPTFIGANADESLILVFDDASNKVVFTFNQYKDYAVDGVSAKEFLEAVYGTGNASEELVMAIASEISKGELSRERRALNSQLVFKLVYEDKETAVVFDPSNPSYWVLIEGHGVGIEVLVMSTKKI